MAKDETIWVVVADGARAQFLMPRGDFGGLIQAGPAMISPLVHGHARDLGSDRPGRAFESGGASARHAIEPHHDPHKLEKHNFSAAVAGALDEACARGQIDHIVLVAPPRSMGELRQLLSKRVQIRVKLEIQKDLTKRTPAQLWTQLSAPVLRIASGF